MVLTLCFVAIGLLFYLVLLIFSVNIKLQMSAKAISFIFLGNKKVLQMAATNTKVLTDATWVDPEN